MAVWSGSGPVEGTDARPAPATPEPSSDAAPATLLGAADPAAAERMWAWLARPATGPVPLLPRRPSPWRWWRRPGVDEPRDRAGRTTAARAVRRPGLADVRRHATAGSGVVDRRPSTPSPRSERPNVPPAPPQAGSPDRAVARPSHRPRQPDRPAGGASLLAAGLLAELTRRRQGIPGRLRGRREELLLAADTGAAHFLDRATRLLSAELAVLGRPLPPVFAATLTDDALVLHLAPAPAEPPPEPWWKGGAAGTWRIDRLADTPDGLPPGRAATIPPTTPAPFPGLATVGFAAERARILVDLEGAPGTISIGGHLGRAREIAVSIAVELATNRWSDEVRVYLVGFHDDPSAIAPGRLRSVDTIEAALADLAAHQRVRTHVRTPAGWDAGQGGRVLLGRQAISTQALWTPDLLVLAEPPDDATADLLAQYAQGRDQAVGVLVVGETRSARWVFTASRDGRLSLGVLGLDVAAQRLSGDAYASIIDLFRSVDPYTAEPLAASQALVARPEPPAPVELPAPPQPLSGLSQPPVRPRPSAAPGPGARPELTAPLASVAPPQLAARPEPFLPVLPADAARDPGSSDVDRPMPIGPQSIDRSSDVPPLDTPVPTLPRLGGPTAPPPTRFPQPGRPATRGPISILVPAPARTPQPSRGGSPSGTGRPGPAASPPAPSPAGPASPLQLPWATAPPPYTPGSQPPDPSPDVEIKVLGRPAVNAPGRLPVDQVEELTELVIYLALNPTDPPMRALAAALWPGGAADQVVADAVSRAQAWLGADPRGRPRLGFGPDGRPRLDPAVRCDWRLFSARARRAASMADTAAAAGQTAGLPAQLAASGQSVGAAGNVVDRPPSDGSADLAAALRLVSGPILVDLPAGRYRWLTAAGLDERIRVAVVDVAHRLTGLSLAAGDTAMAMAACRTGLRAVPAAETLWRDLLRTVAARGDRHALEAVAAEMYRALPSATAPPRDHPPALGRRRPDGSAEQETNELVQILLPGYRPRDLR